MHGRATDRAERGAEDAGGDRGQHQTQADRREAAGTARAGRRAGTQHEPHRQGDRGRREDEAGDRFARSLTNQPDEPMDAISEQIQEPELVAEIIEEPEIVAGAITDGSQAIAHDGFDVETFEQAADDYARLARTVTETAGAIHTGPALLRDLFWSFHKRAPRIAPVAPLSPAHEINREIVEQILSTIECREMRESGTIGDPL